MNENHQELFDQLVKDQQDALKSDHQSTREAAIHDVHARIDASEHDSLVKDALVPVFRECPKGGFELSYGRSC
jgi:hypothetical protein